MLRSFNVKRKLRVYWELIAVVVVKAEFGLELELLFERSFELVRRTNEDG